jgi:ribonuclease BN (tRNA processing enzyme)
MSSVGSEVLFSEFMLKSKGIIPPWKSAYVRMANTMPRSISVKASRAISIVSIMALGWPAGATGFSPPPQHSVRLILLGTNGGPSADQTRSQPANLLVVDGKPYLIDAGDGVARQLSRAGFAPDQIRTIFITHHHIDHNAGLEPLMAFSWFSTALSRQRERPPVQVYGPPSTRYIVQMALNYLSVSERIFRAGINSMPPAAGMFEAHDIAGGGLVYSDGTVRVTAVRNTHYHAKSGAPEPQDDASYSYRFDTPNGAIVFTGDTGPSDAVTAFAKGADVLVSEIYAPPPDTPESDKDTAADKALRAQMVIHMNTEHLKPEEVGKLASRAGVKTVLLTHLFAGGDPKDMTQYTRGVQAEFSGEVIPGQDLLEYDLTRSRVRQ